MHAQTVCGSASRGPGVFICYPNPNDHPTEKSLATVFHLSGQANAPPGHKITRYAVLIDNQRLLDTRLPSPVERLSIETDLKSPFNSDSHTLRLVVDGTGSAEVAGLGFHRSNQLGFCDPFNRVDPRSCFLANLREPLQWDIKREDYSSSVPFSDFLSYLDLYGQNLGSVEADVADGFAVDGPGNLYTVSHRAADVEIRKFAPNGSLVYDNLVRSCGGGFVSVVAIALNESGLLWIAGNATACLAVTANAFETQSDEPSRLHGFVMLIDTKARGSAPPVYVTYLSRVENRIRALRVDKDGNAYVAGTTVSRPAKPESFVSVLNSSGSALQWSTVLPGVELNALVIGSSSDVYVTGRRPSGRSGAPSEEAFLAVLSDSGRKLMDLAHFGGRGISAGMAISTDPAERWVFVTGSTQSTDLLSPAFAANKEGRKLPAPFALAVQPCERGSLRLQLLPAGTINASPEIAIQPALDAFARALPASFPRANEAPPNCRPVGQ